MRTSGPATRPTLPFFQLRNRSFHMLSSRFRELNVRHPADPFVPRERRKIIPLRESLRIGG